MTLKLLNLKYSPNVGDGLLVECLEAHLAATIGTSELTSIDLAGRTDYAAHDGRREILMRVLGAMPSVARRQVARAGLSLKWRWASAATTASRSTVQARWSWAAATCSPTRISTFQ